jgi:F-type H+-transporting ATPase subunit b
MEIVENVALISINATFVVQLLSFLLFMMLLNRIMIRPLRKVMTERDHYLVQVKDQIHAAHEGYAQIGEQIRQQESETRKTALQMREEMEQAAQESAAEVIEQTRVEIASLRAESQQNADQQITAARRQIIDEAEALSDRMINALLDRRATS